MANLVGMELADLRAVAGADEHRPVAPEGDRARPAGCGRPADKLKVLAVPNTYFGGDVAVTGLLSGRCLLAVKDQLEGDFVLIPSVTIKSDEPIFIDGMPYADLKRQCPVPVFDLDVDGLLDLLAT